VIIAGAGGSAHLPGMVASMTTLPVLGVPVQSKALSGMDSLLSIVQMPGGVPVGTLAIGNSGATNAALLAAQILANTDSSIREAVEKLREEQTNSVAEVPSDTEHTSHSSNPVVSTIQHSIKEPLESKLQTFTLLPPGKTIGIVGGGQLAKMIAQSATQFGYRIHVYCPDKLSPAFHVCDNRTIADYKDERALKQFASQVDVVTYEFENIPLVTLETLSKYVPLRPKKEILGICQHRVKEKKLCE